MLNRYFVIDDFYNDPDQLVNLALESLNVGVLRGNYAGVMSRTAFLTPQHRSLFRQLLNEPVIDSATELNGKIRFSKQNDDYVQNIHFDGGSKTRWSGVVYLSKHHPKVDGTVFWKHAKTGLEEIPKTFTIPYKYNRLVLFRPWLFHSPGEPFGSTLDSSRIVQTLFLGA